MGRKAVAKALKDRIPDLYYLHKLHPEKIAKYLGMKKTCVYDTLRYYRLYRTTSNPFACCPGRKATLRYVHHDFLHDFLQKNPCAYLDEMQDAILQQYGFMPTIPILVRALRHLDYTNKMVSKVALERDEVRRAVFQYTMGKVAPDADMLMFLDEASKNEKTPGRMKGWSLRGTRCVQRRCFVRGQRYSILPAITLDGIVALEVIEGSVTSGRFCQFLREQVIPLTNPYPGPRSCIVLDNCSFHHSEEIRKLVEDDAGCRLIFLPPYSPDLNPIELAFSSIKAYLRRQWNRNTLCTIYEACHNIDAVKAYEYFAMCGYCT